MSKSPITRTHMVFLLLLLYISFSPTNLISTGASPSCCPNHLSNHNTGFKQKTDRFYQFDTKSNTWVEVKLPYDLITCVNGNCTKVGEIQKVAEHNHKPQEESDASYEERHQNLQKNNEQKMKEEKKIINHGRVLLPLRKRVSLTKLSELSIWVTGESGSVYERYWNGVQWVIIPHHLPEPAGHAVSVFIVNQTAILALSGAGYLYQIQLNEKAQPVWTEISVTLRNSIEREAEQRSKIQIKSGLVSHNRERVYFCTKSGSLLELVEIEPPRWIDYGRPPGGDVAAIAAAASIKTESVFIISSAGELYQHDHSSKPSWKKHIQREGDDEDNLLLSTKGCSLEGLNGPHTLSIFLIAKAGTLVERRLISQKKWKWVVHGSPVDQLLTSITPFSQDESDGKLNSLLLTTASGSAFEYLLQKSSGYPQEDPNTQPWLNHLHPPHAKLAKGIQGLQYQTGRIIFPLDDGRLGELHIPGHGGETSGPNNRQAFNRRKPSSIKYIWSPLDAPETEGWNAEYCTEERGPSNCMIGVRDGGHKLGNTRFTTRRRKGHDKEQSYLTAALKANDGIPAGQEFHGSDNWIRNNFHLRVMHMGRSFFLVTDDGGMTFEYLYNENNVWLWLQHEHTARMRGAVGTYNGSLFLVDANGNLLIRERREGGLGWMNCTGMRKGRQIIGGPPWNIGTGVSSRAKKIAAEDSLFFTGKDGELLQFTVSNRKFKWKGCKTPPNTKTATIVDQEGFRDNIIFVIGTNGQLYQYNKLTGLWHKHHQSPHLVLSRLPGTAARGSTLSLKGSLFMISEDGGLVEYHWNPVDGWSWVEHGTPHGGVRFDSAPGPCFQGNQLFLVGSDGSVYLRYLYHSEWMWKNFGSPYLDNGVVEEERRLEEDDKADVCLNKDSKTSLAYREEATDPTGPASRNCDTKVACTRPIPFAENSVIFELRDGRLAELRRVKEDDWIWSHIIPTPTSSCMENYWTVMAS